jgi:hypothetical protein
MLTVPATCMGSSPSNLLIQRVKQLRGKPIVRSRPKPSTVLRTIGNPAHDFYHARGKPVLDYCAVSAGVGGIIQGMV